MNCPNCGAALQAIPNRDHFHCSHCGTLHFPDSIGEGIVLLGIEHKFACPCCDQPLAAGTIDGDEVGYCRDCRGILLDSDLFARTVARRREEKSLRHNIVEPIDSAELRRVSKCPRCRLRFDTHVYGGGGNAVIDSCARCRLVWLDAGELTVLEQFSGRR